MSDDRIRLDDLLRAFAALRPRDENARKAIARLLGIQIQGKTKETKEIRKQAPKILETKAKPPVVEPPAVTPPQPSATTTPTGAEAATILRPARRVAATPPDWLATVKPFPEPDSSPPSPPPLDPLFQPRWTRGILAASASVMVEAGPLDVSAVVAAITEGRELRRVPRRPIVRMANGIQVLVDGSDSMLPFAADQEWLVDRIATTAGRDRTEVLGISGGESFVAGSDEPFEWKGYFLHCVPTPGVAVILISDLGIGRPPLARTATPAQWAAFAREVHRRECPLVAIVPYAPSRWPAVLRRALPIVQWDPGTNARAARKAVGRSLARKWAR